LGRDERERRGEGGKRESDEWDGGWLLGMMLGIEREREEKGIEKCRVEKVMCEGGGIGNDVGGQGGGRPIEKGRKGGRQGERGNAIGEVEGRYCG
jgi:hypothetical protein